MQHRHGDDFRTRAWSHCRPCSRGSVIPESHLSKDMRVADSRGEDEGMTYRSRWMALALGCGLAGAGAALAYSLAGGGWAAAGAAIGALSGAFAPALYEAIGQESRRRVDSDPQSVNASADDLARVVELTSRREIGQASGADDSILLPVQWTLDRRSITSEDEFLTKDNDLATAFLRLPNRRMIILGSPGSGKTVLSLRLVRELLARRRSGEPVPVLLRAVTWDPQNEVLDSWISASLSRDYNVKPRIATQLATEGLLIPVVDGLDELPDRLRGAAIAQISRGTNASRSLIVTSREMEFDRMYGSGLLSEAVVVHLRPPSAMDVAAYLDLATGPEKARWQPVIDHLRAEPDGRLARALSTPQMAGLILAAYKSSGDPQELLDPDRFPGTAEIEAHLLDPSVEAIVRIRTDQAYPTGPVRRWLASLASITTQLRYGLIRGRLAAESGTALAAKNPVVHAREEIADEIIRLPMATRYIALDPSGARRNEVREMVSDAVMGNWQLITDAAAGQFVRFQQSRSLMAQAIGQPRWSRPVRAYGLLAGIFGGIATVGYGLVKLGPTGLRWTAIVAFGAAAASILLCLIRKRGTNGSVPLMLASWLAVWTLIAIVVSLQLPSLDPRSVRATALVAAVAATLLIVAWGGARPYERDRAQLQADDPSQWPSAVHSVRRYFDAAIQARQDWLSTVVRDGVVPIIRGRLTHGQDSDLRTLRDLDPARLGGIQRSDELVDTAADQRISWLLNHLDSGSIGISGLRGSGKSTLLQHYCTYEFGARSNDILVFVSAPTVYDSREFLIHMFSQVCMRITDTTFPGAYESGRRTSRLGRVASALMVMVGLSLVVGTLTWPTINAWVSTRWRHPTLPLLVVGVLLAASGTAWVLWLGRRASQPKRHASEAEIAASEHLRALRYQATISRTRDGKVSLPGGLEFGTSGQLQRTEQVRAYPELIAQFRALLDQVGLERRPLGGRVVIGIDELDKMTSGADAERFLNDLKAIFGVPGCYFLVAVSEDALATFDSRALGVRTAFDSAFDGIVPVRPLTVAEARTLLDRRGIWLPEPFLWLCHMLAGGLPRDILRAVLALATAMSLKGLNQLDELSGTLIREDLMAVLQSQARHANAYELDHFAVSEWLARALGDSSSATSLEDLICDAPAPSGSSEAAILIWQTRAYLYYAATLIRMFTDDSVSIVKWLIGNDNLDPVDWMANARAVMATHPDLTWRGVQRYREISPGNMPLLPSTEPQ